MTSDGFLRLLKTFGIVLVKNRSLEDIRSLKKPLEGFLNASKCFGKLLMASEGF